MQTLDDLKAEVRAVEYQAQEAKAWVQFHMKYPQYACDANKQLFKEFIDPDYLITLEVLEDALPFLVDRLAVKDTKRIQDDFIAEQTSLLEEASGLLASWTDAGRADRQKQLARMQLPQLRIEVQNLKDAARLKTLSRKDLRQATRAEYAAAHPQLVGGFPKLPDDFPPIRSLSPVQIREAAKKYGWSQLNSHQR